MKKMITAIALTIGTAAFASGTKVDTAAIDSLKGAGQSEPRLDVIADQYKGADSTKRAQFDSLVNQFKDKVSKDSALMNAFKAKASADSAKLAALKAQAPKRDTNWAAQVPDSVKFTLDSSRVLAEKSRDSLVAAYKAEGDSLKAKFDTLKAESKSKRDAYLGQLNAQDKAKIEPKVADFDKKSAARDAAIEKGAIEAKARQSK